MHSMKSIFWLLFLTSAALARTAEQGQTRRARQLQQLAGAGEGCDSILTQTDNASGYGVENGENNVASDVGKVNSGRKLLTKYFTGNAVVRLLGRKLTQNAGTGSACNSVLTQTDNSVGYGVENAENNGASDLTGAKGRRLSSVPVTLFGRSLLQLDKMSNGAANVASAGGANQLGGTIKEVGDNDDGDATGDLATSGQEVGQLEDDTLIPAGSAVPGRKLFGRFIAKGRSLLQLDKMSNGAANVANAGGANQLGGTIKEVGDNDDGDATGDLATSGQQVGQLEDDTLIPAGSAVPGRKLFARFIAKEWEGSCVCRS